MYRLDMYSGASLLRTLYMNKPLLYSICFCRLIILISFNFRSVVRVVSGRIKGPVKAVSGHKIAPNRFKTTYRSVLTF